MSNLETIKAKLEENNKIIEMLTLKKQQDEQIRILNEQKIEAQNKAETDPKYITKVVAAQELITYLLKYRLYGLGMLIPAFISIFAAKFNYFFTIILAFVSVVFGLIQFMHIKKALYYLNTKYKLPGYERYLQPNIVNRFKQMPKQQQTHKQSKKNKKVKREDPFEYQQQVKNNINKFFNT